MRDFLRKHLYGIVVGTVLFLFCFSLIALLFWGVLTSFKERSDYLLDKLGFPKNWYFDNYKEVFEGFYLDRTINKQKIRFGLFDMLLNTVYYAGGSAFLSTMTCCIVAYLTAKYPFKFSKFIHSLVVVVMIIPVVGSMPSSIVLLDGLGLMDNILALWLKSMSFTGLNYLIFYASFKALPWSYAESAFMDGASHATVMFRIMIPLVVNTISVMFLISFVQLWNEYQAPMVYWKSYPTIAVGLFGYMMNPKNSSIPEQVACCIVTVVPVVALFLAFKNKMMGNLTLGGLKG